MTSLKGRYFRSLSHLQGEWPIIGASAVLSSLAAVAEAASLVLVVSLAESLTANSGTVNPSLGPVTLNLTFLESVGLASALLVSSAATRVAAGYVTIRRMTALAREWRAKLLAGFIESSFAYSTTVKKGEALETAGQQTTQGSQVVDLMALMLNSIFTMLILTAVAFALDPIVATVLLAGGGLVLLVLRPLSKGVRIMSGEVAQKDVEFSNALDEAVRVNRDIRLFGATKRYEQEADAIAAQSEAIDRRRQIYSRSIPIAYQAIGSLLLLTALAVSYNMAGASLTAIGGAALLLLRGITYGQRVSTFQQALARALPFLESVQRQLEKYRSHAVGFGAKKLDEVHSIELDAVGYSYQEDGLPAVQDISITLKEHGITGLVGPSGSGKSTIAQILLRLRTPTSGQMLVNGDRADAFNQSSWQQAVSFVPQETDLVHGTVGENVGFFRDWISQSDIEEAIESVGLTDLVRSLPQGLDTQIGPTVHNFSGGQKQRIGIARALVGNPSLFVLDEPTSSLDEESEQWVMKTVTRLGKSRFVIVITHRASTLQHCDAVVELKDGRIVSASSS